MAKLETRAAESGPGQGEAKPVVTVGPRRRPVAIDLYAGAGGLSYGAERAGFDVIAAAEFDPVHAIVHRYNMPETPVLCRDLSDGSPGEIAAEILDLARAGLAEHGRAGEQLSIDAVIGGPPCQGFSVGGVRDVADARNNQLLRFIDLVVEIQPRVFCLENVAGLLESRFDDLRDEAIRRLRAGGYVLNGFDRVVNAADFGVPQSRRRVIVFGARGDDAPSMADVKFERVTVADALAGLPELSKYRRLLASDEVQLTEEDLASLLGVQSEYAQRLVGVAVDPADLSVPRRHDPAILTGSRRTVHARKSVQRFARTAQGEAEKISRLFRLDPRGQARTLRAGTGTDRGSHTSPRPIHPTRNRVITVREAARLHGYPDWFRFNTTNWHGHRQVGNSVPPPLAAAAGRALLSALGVEDLSRPTERLTLGDPSWLSLSGTKAREELRRQSDTWARIVSPDTDTRPVAARVE